MKVKPFTALQQSELLAHMRVAFPSGKLQGFRREEYATHCPNPNCGSHGRHDKRKMEINLKVGIYNCWVCGTRGVLAPKARLIHLARKNGGRVDGLVRWLTQCRNWNHSAGSSWEAQILAELRAMLSAPEDSDTDVAHVVELGKLPWKRWVDTTRDEHPEAWLLWDERWGSEADTLKPIQRAWEFDVRFYEKDGKPRWAFPAWGEWGELTGIHWWKPLDPLKYWDQGTRSDFLVGIHAIDWSQPVNLVEGIWDALRSGSNTIPLFGSHLVDGSGILNTLVRKDPPLVRVALDRDAQKKAWKVAQKLNGYGLSVEVLEPPKADPALSDKPIEEWETHAVPYGWEQRVMQLL